MSKLYKYAGFTIRTGKHRSTGLFKIRVSNSAARHKVLSGTENEHVLMFELPEPMSKERAAVWIAFESLKGIAPVERVNS